MMDAVDKLELAHGIYPVAFDRRWHTGAHLAPSVLTEKVRAIADGEVVAYRVCQHAIEGSPGSADSSAGFVLLKHKTETGDGRVLTFYSLYMHLLEFDRYNDYGTPLDVLPPFLRVCSPGPDMHPPVAPPSQSGSGQKVYRKDVLGLMGKCHGQRHLHFEIFMTQADFNAYFGTTQLGKTQLTTPAKPDCWGSTYYVISGAYNFTRVPVDQTMTRENKLHGIAFQAQTDGRLPANHKLYVEVYFHLGQRYTRSWLDKGDGQPMLLTRSPVADASVDYEYDLYKRATALYPACPSDGYEMLRFGRILSTPVTLQDSAARKTWISVVFDEAGTQGYIDVADNAIQKLSDADFPFFTGWKKLSEDHGPFDSDGLCDIDSLKKLLGDAKTDAAASGGNVSATVVSTVQKKGDQLIAYVKSHPAIRKQLRGLVCEAPSEWDSSNHEARYAKLKQAGEFYENNPRGYAEFMHLLNQFQFWGSTPLVAGEKLWFFHPLEFIRHFRKCGWLSEEEFKQVYENKRYKRTQNPEEIRATYLRSINGALRKYGLTTPLRASHFLGQGAVESSWLTLMQETSMVGEVKGFEIYGRVVNLDSTMKESTLGHWYGAISTEDDPWFRLTKFSSSNKRITGSYDWRNGNCDREDAQKYRGRGFKQLTGRSNYADYWLFRGWLAATSFSSSWWTDPAYLDRARVKMKKQPALIADPQRVAIPENCIDSGGFYMRFCRPKVAREIDKDNIKAAISISEKQLETTISSAVTYAINGGFIDGPRRLDYTRNAKNILI
ncbi:hypothetical protein ASG35_08505 [Burkholderia sp. Leaf177]|nr:hypothetical protein ASG35_08505 [Burkholderia sp. Leaf177]